MAPKNEFTGQYADVNGIRMYYEIHGTGAPVVLLHGGGSTINTTFGRIMPELSKTRQTIAVELQAHGRTSDRDENESFGQDADDVAELLRQLNIPKADIFGFSNGGQTAMELYLRRPELVRKLVIASAFYKKDGAPAGFWEGFKNVKLSDLPQIYKDEFLSLGNSEAALLNMFNRDVQRMATFIGWTEDDLRKIAAPALIVIGDKDMPSPEHAAEMYRLIPNSRLAILPGTHGSYMGEAMDPNTGSKVPELFVAMVNEFLESK